MSDFKQIPFTSQEEKDTISRLRPVCFAKEIFGFYVSAGLSMKTDV
jgi:hypothetical protein